MFPLRFYEICLFRYIWKATPSQCKDVKFFEISIERTDFQNSNLPNHLVSGSGAGRKQKLMEENGNSLAWSRGTYWQKNKLTQKSRLQLISSKTLSLSSFERTPTNGNRLLLKIQPVNEFLKIILQHNKHCFRGSGSTFKHTQTKTPRYREREADTRSHLPIIVTFTPSVSHHVLLSHSSSSSSPLLLSVCMTHPCYISLPRLPLNGKQLGRGLPRAHHAQSFNEFPSTSPLSSSVQWAPLLLV